MSSRIPRLTGKNAPEPERSASQSSNDSSRRTSSRLAAKTGSRIPGLSRTASTTSVGSIDSVFSQDDFVKPKTVVTTKSETSHDDPDDQNSTTKSRSTPTRTMSEGLSPTQAQPFKRSTRSSSRASSVAPEVDIIEAPPSATRRTRRSSRATSVLSDAGEAPDAFRTPKKSASLTDVPKSSQRRSRSKAALPELDVVEEDLDDVVFSSQAPISDNLNATPTKSPSRTRGSQKGNQTPTTRPESPSRITRSMRKRGLATPEDKPEKIIAVIDFESDDDFGSNPNKNSVSPKKDKQNSEDEMVNDFVVVSSASKTSAVSPKKTTPTFEKTEASSKKKDGKSEVTPIATPARKRNSLLVKNMTKALFTPLDDQPVKVSSTETATPVSGKGKIENNGSDDSFMDWEPIPDDEIIEASAQVSTESNVFASETKDTDYVLMESLNKAGSIRKDICKPDADDSQGNEDNLKIKDASPKKSPKKVATPKKTSRNASPMKTPIRDISPVKVSSKQDSTKKSSAKKDVENDSPKKTDDASSAKVTVETPKKSPTKKTIDNESPKKVLEASPQKSPAKKVADCASPKKVTTESPSKISRKDESPKKSPAKKVADSASPKKLSEGSIKVLKNEETPKKDLLEKVDEIIEEEKIAIPTTPKIKALSDGKASNTPIQLKSESTKKKRKSTVAESDATAVSVESEKQAMSALISDNREKTVGNSDNKVSSVDTVSTKSPSRAKVAKIIAMETKQEPEKMLESEDNEEHGNKKEKIIKTKKTKQKEDEEEVMKKDKKGKKAAALSSHSSDGEDLADPSLGGEENGLYPDLTFKELFKKPKATGNVLSTSLSSLYSWTCQLQKRPDDLCDVFMNKDIETIWQQIAHKNKQIFKDFRKNKDLLDEKIELTHEAMDDEEEIDDEEDAFSDEEDIVDEEELDDEDFDDEENGTDLFNLKGEDLAELERKLQNDEEDDDDEEDAKKVQKKFPKSSVDDKFFNLAEMDAFLDEAEKRNNDDDGLLLTVDDDWGGSADYKYEEFFGKLGDSVQSDPKDKKAKKRPRCEQPEESAPKKKKSVRWVDEQEAVDDEQEDEEDIEDEEEDDSSPVLLGETQTEEEQPLTNLKLSQKKLKETIKQIEEENLQPRSWELSGEVSAQQRSENALLETHLDFEHGLKKAPEVNEDFTEKLESIILQRIKDNVFDDVVRKKKVEERVEDYRNEAIEEREMVKKSLSEVYEKEYQKAAGETEKDKPNEAHLEIEKRMAELFTLVDALSHHEFTPPEVRPEIKVVSNMDALRVEEVGMMASTDSQLLAPEEVKKREKGDIKADDERTTTDKLRQRRKKKNKQRAMVMVMGDAAKKDGGDDKKKKKDEKEGQTLKSSNFFNKLQDTVQKELKEKTTKKTKLKSEKISSGGSKFKL